jgi:3-oxoadipate enol-lactonase
MPMAKVNGIEVNYVDQGSGEVLLLIHNVISNIETYEYAIAELSKDYRVVACDLRGHGKTTKCEDPALVRDFYRFDNIVEDIHQLLTQLRIARCHVLGQAYWGVSTAFTFFFKHPEMVDSIIAVAWKLSSSETGDPNDALDEKTKAQFIRMQQVAAEQGMLALYEERKRLRTFWSDAVLGNEDVMRRFRDMYEATAPAAFVNFPPQDHVRHEAIASLLRERKPPVALLLGALDSHNPVVIEGMERDYPGGVETVLLSDCGHYPAMENPDAFNRAVLAFLAKHPSS